MAIIDTEHDVIVVRIVYDGPPFSGKSASVRALGNLLGRTPTVLSLEETAGKQTLYLDWMEYKGGLFKGYSISCQIVSVPGQLPLAAYHHYLLQTADAVVFVLDASSDDLEMPLRCFKNLQQLVAPLGENTIQAIIQANKQDQPHAATTAQLTEIFQEYPEIRIVESSALSGKGVREAFVLAIRLAIGRAATLMAKGQMLYGKPEINSGEELISALRQTDFRGQEKTGIFTELPKTFQVSEAVDREESQVTVPRTEESDKPIITKLSLTKHLPQFPDENTPTQWIWPPFHGRSILNKVLKQALKPRLQHDNWWVIQASKQWYCFSKMEWQYPEADQARQALRTHLRLHLECSPILSEHRCIVVAIDETQKSWRLWQIVPRELTLAEHLVDSLRLNNSPAQVALASYRCAARYVEALQKCLHYPPILNLTLDTLGVNAESQLVYLGYIEENSTVERQAWNTTTLSKAIKQEFAARIVELLPQVGCEVAEVIREFSKIEEFEQAYVVDTLKQLFNV